MTLGTLHTGHPKMHWAENGLGWLLAFVNGFYALCPWGPLLVGFFLGVFIWNLSNLHNSLGMVLLRETDQSPSCLDTL